MSRRPLSSTDGSRAPECIQCRALMLDGGDRWWCRGTAARHELEIVWPEDAPKRLASAPGGAPKGGNAGRTPRDVCRMIAADMKADAAALDGQPFNGRVVATTFGGLMAAVAALAKIVETVCPEELGEVCSTHAYRNCDFCRPTSEPFVPPVLTERDRQELSLHGLESLAPRPSADESGPRSQNDDYPL